MGANSLHDRYVVFFISLLSFLTFYALLIFFLQSDFTNFIFVDGVIWYEFIQTILSKENQLSEVKAAYGYLGFYYVLMFVGELPLVLICNLFFIFYIFTRKNMSCYVYLFFPFYFICFFLPSKDLILLLPTYYFFKFLIRKNFLIVFILSFFVFFLRDAYGVALFIVASILFLKINFKITIIGTFFVCLFLDKYLKDIAAYTDFFVFERTLKHFSVSGTDYKGYFVRVIGNLTNSYSRAVFFTNDGKISLTGISFLFSGIGVFQAFLLSLYSIFFNKRPDFCRSLKILSFINLMILVMFSFSPLIQPRYLIPVSLFVIFYSHSVGKKINLIFLFLSVILLSLLRTLYYYSDIGLPVADSFSYSYIELFR